MSNDTAFILKSETSIAIYLPLSDMTINKTFVISEKDQINSVGKIRF